MSYVYSLPRSSSQGRHLDLSYGASLPRDRRQEGARGSVNNVNDDDANPVGLTTARSGELVDGGTLRKRTLERPKKSTVEKRDRDASGDRLSSSRGSSIERQLSDYEPTCATLERRQRSASSSRQNSCINGHGEFSGALDDELWSSWEKTFQQLDHDLKKGGVQQTPLRRNKFDKIDNPLIKGLPRESHVKSKKPEPMNGFANGKNSWMRHSAREYRRDTRPPGAASFTSREQTSYTAPSYESQSSRTSSSSGVRENKPEGPRLNNTHHYERTGGSSRGYASDSEDSLSWLDRQRQRLGTNKLQQNVKLTTNSLRTRRGFQTDENNNAAIKKTEAFTYKQGGPAELADSRRGRTEQRENSSQRSYSFTTGGYSPGRFRFQSLPRKSKADRDEMPNDKFNSDIHKYTFDDEDGLKSNQSDIGFTSDRYSTNSRTDSLARSRLTAGSAATEPRRSQSAASDRLKQFEQQQWQQQQQQQRQQKGSSFYKSSSMQKSGSRELQEPDDYIEISLEPIGVRHLEPQEQSGSRFSTLNRSSTLGRTSNSSTFDRVHGFAAGSMPRPHSSATIDHVTRSRHQSSGSEKTYNVKPESYLRKPGAYTAKPEPYVEQSAKHWSGVQTLPTGPQKSWSKSSFDSDPRWQTLQTKYSSKSAGSRNQQPSAGYTTSVETKSSHYLNPESIHQKSAPVQFGSGIHPGQGSAPQRRSDSADPEIRRPIPISPNLSKGFRHQNGHISSEFAFSGSRTLDDRRNNGSSFHRGGSETPEGAIREYLRSQEHLMSEELNQSRGPNADRKSNNEFSYKNQPNEYRSETIEREIRTVNGQPLVSTERRTFDVRGNQSQNKTSVNNQSQNEERHYAQIPSAQRSTAYNSSSTVQTSSGSTQFKPGGHFGQQTSGQGSGQVSNRERDLELADLEPFLREFTEQPGATSQQQKPINTTFQRGSAAQGFANNQNNQFRAGSEQTPSSGSLNSSFSNVHPVRVINLQAANHQQQASVSSTPGGSLPRGVDSVDHFRAQNSGFDYQEPVSSKRAVQNGFNHTVATVNSAQNSHSSAFNHQTNGPFKTQYEESSSVSYTQALPKGFPQSKRINVQETANSQSQNSAFIPSVEVRNTNMVRPTAFQSVTHPTHFHGEINPQKYIVEQRQKIVTNQTNKFIKPNGQPSGDAWKQGGNVAYNQAVNGIDDSFSNSLENSFDKLSDGVDGRFHQTGYQTYELAPKPPPSNSSMDSNQSPHSLELETRFRSTPGRGFSPAAQSSPSVSVDRSSAGSLDSSRDGIEPVSQGPYSVKFIRDISHVWYKPQMPREQIVAALRSMQPGSFIIRDSSSYPGSFALAVKVSELPANIHSKGDSADDELVRHFLIEPTSKGVRLKGYKSEPVFGSLAALVYQHTLTAIALPCKLLLPTTAINNFEQVQATSSSNTFIDQGATVLYIKSEDTELLTGPEAIERTTSAALRLTNPQTTLVQLTVSNDGVTVTDSDRKVFFRRHYPLRLITYCGFERKHRSWTEAVKNDGGEINSRIFGFVSRKMNNPNCNECHIFAELALTEGDSIVEAISRAVELSSTGLSK